MLEGIPKNN